MATNTKKAFTFNTSDNESSKGGGSGCGSSSNGSTSAPVKGGNYSNGVSSVKPSGNSSTTSTSNGVVKKQNSTKEVEVEKEMLCIFV